MHTLFDSTAPIDPRREAQALHAVCSMANGDKRDAVAFRRNEESMFTVRQLVAQRIRACHVGDGCDLNQDAACVY